MTTVTRAKIGRGDVALFDGANRTFNRLDATGGTTTQLRLGDRVDVLQVFGAGTSRTRATLANAINNIGSAVCTLQIAGGTWTIDDNLTVPATMAVVIPAGCVLAISAGKTLTFSGPVHVDYSASNGTGWYSGSGTIVCSQGASGFPGW